MLSSVLLNSIIFFFPFLCYYLYLVYSNIKEKERDIFFDLAVITSVYLCIRFNSNINSVIIYSVISFLLALNKKRILPVVVLLFIIPYLFYTYNILRLNIVAIFILIIIYYYVIKYLFNKVENMIKVHQSLYQISKEKKLYDSLFKITHEIKNPLAVCKGYIDMFNANDIKKSNKYISIIGEEIERTLLILNDFSDISKINIEFKEVNITELLYDVCDEYQSILDNITFEINIFNKDVIILGDYNRLKQVFVNILKNSSEAVKKSGKINISSSINKNNYIITIKDNGIGMDKATLKKIGSAFYTTKKHGTGLGVCFSKEIILRHNGSIKYYSKESVGTTVIIKIPIKKII